MTRLAYDRVQILGYAMPGQRIDYALALNRGLDSAW